MLKQSTINKKIDNCFKKLGTENTPENITRILDRSFRQYNIRFYYQINPFIDKNQIETWGYFIPDEKPRISIVFVVSKEHELYNLDEEQKFNLSTTIQHEFRHWYQHVRRKGKFFGEKNVIPNLQEDVKLDQLIQYFSIPDEIDAYAHNILLELSRAYPNLNKSHFTKKKLSASVTFRIYQYIPKLKPIILKKIYKLYEQGFRYIA